MKRFIFEIIVTLLITASLFSVGCSNDVVLSNNEENPKTLPVLEYCDLKNNPDKYDGKIVRLNAEIKAGQHGEHLYDPQCPADESIKTYYDATAAVIFANQSDRDKITEIRENRNPKLWTEPINVIVIGEFKKNKPTEKDSGYDRNAVFHFVINSIESFPDIEK